MGFFAAGHCLSLNLLFFKVLNLIAQRIHQALKHVHSSEFEDGLIQLSIALDATSKKELRSGISQSERNTQFIDNHRDFLYRFSTGGAVSVKGSIIDPQGTLGRLLYKVIRCGLLHEGVMPNGFSFLKGMGVGGFAVNTENLFESSQFSGFIISSNLLDALCMVVIASEINYRESFTYKATYQNYGVKIEVV